MKEFLSRSAKVVALAIATSMVAIAAPAHAETDRTEFTGGHIDAFYVYNLPEETSHKEDGKYETKIHLDVKEDVTG
ncbi:hypothetical protein B1R42_07710, partial [Trueperella pyogenes]